MATPKEHIEKMRKDKFCIGKKENPLIEDLHHAVKQLSAELYTKDVHFLMELIQNAEDNDYEPDVEPSLEFVITTEDVAGVGATATLLVFNNEKGFQRQNIDYICSVGRSTKKNNRGAGYIGEKGIGFKSVFLVTSQPFILSNGYKIRFNEVPPPDVKIGYIIPEWIRDRPCTGQLEKIYGSCLPNTVIVLPLRPEKIEAVKQQLSSIHPEILLFMSKIKKLSVRQLEHNDLSKIYTISVLPSTTHQTSKSNEYESFTLYLLAEEDQISTRQCNYYMWKQGFSVKKECRVEQRKDVGQWTITLAFPLGERLIGGNMAAAGIYAFLPTEMVTGFPFIIQADFLLVSSRESIIFNNKWNQGILQCIPLAFCSAFRTLISANSPLLTRLWVFKYLPCDSPCNPQLTQVRDAIRAQLKVEAVVLCDVSFGHKNLCKPTEARTILPAFKRILERAGGQGDLGHLFPRNVHIVHPYLDKQDFYDGLKFLGILNVSYNWYSPWIQSSDWLKSLPEDLYVELLCFIVENWKQGLSNHLHDVPLLKYVSSSDNTAWASVSDAAVHTRIYLSSEESHISWLSKWSGELGSAAKYYSLPEATQKAILNLDTQKSDTLYEWLSQHPKIIVLSISKFAEWLLEVVTQSTDNKLVITTTHFLHYSSENNYISAKELTSLCKKIPLVVESGNIIRKRGSLNFLQPASTSNWAKLMGRNLSTTTGFAILSEEYLKLPACVGGLMYSSNDLVSFFKKNLEVADIPELFPPNARVAAVSHDLTEENAFLLLQWIQYLKKKRKMPDTFINSISEGKWLKTSRGFESPARSFLFDFKGESSPLQEDDIPFIDEAFYGWGMREFKDALKKVGVVTEFGKGCDIIVDHHIQAHQDFKAIIRLYKYLQASKWKPRASRVLQIWIPDDGWYDAKSCVIHDVGDLFKSRLKVLEGWYHEPLLLKFFSKSLGVPSHPQLEDYCSLWLEWTGNSSHRILKSECCLVWKNILQNWSGSSSHIMQYLGTSGLWKVPVSTDNGDINVCSRDKAFVPDDLQLKELFKGGSAKLNFTWQPIPSDPEIPLDLLFSIYNQLGVKNISEAVSRIEVSAPENKTLEKLILGEGILGMGLYTIILAYLAKPSFKISSDKRHHLVRALMSCPVYAVNEPLVMEYFLLSARESGGEKNIEVKATRMVRWEKKNKRLLIQIPNRRNEKTMMLFATTFAEVISDGLLVEFPDLVAGLCEAIKIGCLLNFNSEAVDVMLQSKNFQLFVEDEHFLSSIFSRNVSGTNSSTFATCWGGDAVTSRKRKGYL